jgi:hypothetical protein
MGMQVRRPATPLTWLAAAFAAAAATAASRIGADARWLAAVGEEIARLHGLPHAIGYAAVPTVGWHDAPALGQLLFHSLESAFGDSGLLAAQAAAVLVALAAAVADLRGARARDGAGAAVLALVVIGAPAAFLVVRAELFSLALFPVLVLILRHEARLASRRIWLAVPLLAFWANLHGGVLLGYAVFAAYLLLDRARRRAFESGVLLAAGACALVATPALLASISYYRHVLGGEAASQHYGMWAPISFSSPLDIAFVAVAVVLAAAALRGRPSAWELVVLVALAALSAEAGRNGLWFLLFAAVPAARAFGRAEGGSGVLSARAAALCFAVPALVAAIGLAHRTPPTGAGMPLLGRAAQVAHGSPILADPVDAEKLALHGGRIWIGNPLDAFPKRAQRAYLDWLRGDAKPVDAIRVVLVARGTAPQRRLAGDRSFRELGRDAQAVLYGRA